MNSKSTATAPHTIKGFMEDGILSYLKAHGRVESNASYMGCTPEHLRWLGHLESMAPNYRAVLGDRLKSIGADNAAEINKFLKDEGFSIELEEFTDPTMVGGAAALHVGVEWAFKGYESGISHLNDDGTYTQYPAAMLPDAGVEYYQGQTGTIAEIACAGGERVYMTAADKPREGLDLLEHIVRLHTKKQPLGNAYYDGVRFPMLDLSITYDLDDLIDLMIPRPAGNPYRMVKAISEVKFKANHLGAQTDAASAGAVSAMSGPMELVLDVPFFIWKTIDGLHYPVLAAYADTDCWKNPGDFSLNNG